MLTKYIIAFVLLDYHHRCRLVVVVVVVIIIIIITVFVAVVEMLLFECVTMNVQSNSSSS